LKQFNLSIFRRWGRERRGEIIRKKSKFDLFSSQSKIQNLKLEESTESGTIPAADNSNSSFTINQTTKFRKLVLPVILWWSHLHYYQINAFKTMKPLFCKGLKLSGNKPLVLGFIKETEEPESLASALPIPTKFESRRNQIQRFLSLSNFRLKEICFPLIKVWLKTYFKPGKAPVILFFLRRL